MKEEIKMDKIKCSECDGKGGIPVDEYCLSLIGPDGMLVDGIDDYELLNQAAQAGSGAAAYVLGIDAECEGGDEDDFMNNFRMSAKANFVWGNYELGRLLFYNDEPEAIVFLQKAFDQGSVLAAGYLGVAYYWGRCGLSRDVGKAVELCKAYKGSPFEKEGYPQVEDISNFMKHVGSAVQGNADSLTWIASAANALLPNGCEKVCLETLKSAVEKGAQNIDLVFKKSGLHFAEGEIKAFKEMLIVRKEIKKVAAEFLLTTYGKTDRGIYAKGCLQDATKLPSASLSAQVSDIDSAKWSSVRLVIDGCHPIYDFQIAETVEGRIFKKKVRTLVLVGTGSTTDLSGCVTVADLAAYLSANKFDIKSLPASVANVGVGTVARENGVVSKEVYLNYNVARVEFDHDKMALSFAAEDRLFT